MSWLINGIRLDMQDAEKNPDKQTEAVKYILRKLKEIQPKLPATFVYAKHVYTTNRADGSQDKPGNIGIHMTSRFTPLDEKGKPNGMSVAITYYERVEMSADGKTERFTLQDGYKQLNFPGVLVVHPDRQELALYLFAVIEGVFILDCHFKDVNFAYVNKEADAKVIEDKKKDELSILKLVYEEITEDMLVDVSKSIGIENVDAMTEPEIRNEISKRVTGNKEMEKKCREFMVKSPTTELRVIIQDALDKKKILYAPLGTTFAYSYVDGKEPFLKKGTKTQPIEALYDFFVKNSVELDYLKNLLA